MGNVVYDRCCDDVDVLSLLIVQDTPVNISIYLVLEVRGLLHEIVLNIIISVM